MAGTVAVYTSLLGGNLQSAEALRAIQQMVSLVMDNIPIAIFAPYCLVYRRRLIQAPPISPIPPKDQHDRLFHLRF